jgi:gliding-associated putative ABC transporter substrate-binding component GldG
MEVIMTKKQASLITLLVITALVLGVMVSARLWFSLDLTEDKAHTIARVSRNLHNEIPDKVKITYYLSDELKSIVSWPDEIADLISVYADYSRGKIHFEVIDPVKEIDRQIKKIEQQIEESAGEHLQTLQRDLQTLQREKDEKSSQWVERLGIMPRQISSREQNQTSFTIVYSGITIEYLDKIDILPWVDSTETLEYNLTSRIRYMVRDKTRLIGVILGEDALDWNGHFQYLQHFFTQAGYQLRSLNPGEEIPAIINVLFVFGGVETFDDAALFRIDNFIQKGGKALFAVKAVNVNLEDWSAKPKEDNGLLDMLSSYGVMVIPEIVLDKFSLQVPVQQRTQYGYTIMNQTPYAFFINILAENANQEHLVSAGSNGLHLYWASPLEIILPYESDLEAAELFTSSEESWSMTEPFSISIENPYLFERDKDETTGKKILAASVSGVFPSWFADKPVPEFDDGFEANIGAAQKAHIIVVGETLFASDFLSNTQSPPFGYTPEARYFPNIDFMLKAADWLGDDDDIMAIRSRTAYKKLDKLEAGSADEKSAHSFIVAVNVAVMPLLVILAGLFFILLRRAKIRPRTEETLTEEAQAEAEEAENDN